MCTVCTKKRNLIYILFVPQAHMYLRACTYKLRLSASKCGSRGMKYECEERNKKNIPLPYWLGISSSFLPQWKGTLEKPEQPKHFLSFQRRSTTANSREPWNVSSTWYKKPSSCESEGFRKYGWKWCIFTQRVLFIPCDYNFLLGLHFPLASSIRLWLGLTSYSIYSKKLLLLDPLRLWIADSNYEIRME